jgi:hypothetical protein
MTEQLELESLQSGTEGADEYEEVEIPGTNAGRPAVRIARYGIEPSPQAASPGIGTIGVAPSRNYLAPPPLSHKRRRLSTLESPEGDKKRQRTPHEHDTTLYGCPYRIRNPTRFTLQAHSVCATQPYSDFSMLKYIPLQIQW